MKLYFHVDRAFGLKVGSVLQNEPYRGESILPALMPYADECYMRHLGKLCRDGISLHGARYLIRSAFDNISIKDCLLELQFEYVRNIYFKKLPSRLQSLFGFENLTNAKQFKEACGGTGLIFETEPSGLLFRADMNWLKFDFTPEEQKNNAMFYWEGKPLSRDKHYTPRWEVLMQLPVTILREVTE